MGEHYVLIKEYKSDMAIKVMGPFGERDAEKVDKGLNSNLNHSEYYALIATEKEMFWLCKHCGENERPRCPKCTREDGLLVTDELVED